MGVVQEVTATDGDHRTGWTRLDRQVQSSSLVLESDAIFDVRVNDIVGLDGERKWETSLRLRRRWSD